MPVRAACDTLRLVSAHRASSSACRRPELAADLRIVPRRRRARRHRLRDGRPARADSRCALSSSETNAGAPLEAEGDHGDPPAVVLVADTVGDRHAHLVEEHLAELGLDPTIVRMRPDLDAGRGPSGRISQVMPRCLGASGSVRTSSSQ